MKLRRKMESFESSVYSEEVRNYLKLSLEKAQIATNYEVRQKILRYIELMIKWNRAYNLTSVRDPKQIIARHIMDSLSILPYIKGDLILDVGSGAGLPGIPLALLNLQKDVVLLDSNNKKAQFLHYIKADLELDNVEVHQERVEDFDPGYRFDVIVARAFSSIGKILTMSQHLCSKTGQFLLMKGIYPEAEMSEITDEFKVADVHNLKIFDIDGERTLVCIEPSSDKA